MALVRYYSTVLQYLFWRQIEEGAGDVVDVVHVRKIQILDFEEGQNSG